MGSAGKIAMEEEKGTCEMLIELYPLIEVGRKRVPIVPLSPSSSLRCEETVSVVSYTSCTLSLKAHVHPETPPPSGQSLKYSPVHIEARGHLFS